MNKRLIALLLAVLLILCAGCKGKKDATEPAATVEATEVTPTETLHPALADNPFKDENGNPVEEETAAATDGATEPEETEEPTEGATEPEETEKPTESATEPSEPEATEDDGEMTYEKFMALSAAEQQAFMNSFPTIEAFFEWFNAAKEAYEASRNEIEIGDGSFDIGDLINGSN